MKKIGFYITTFILFIGLVGDFTGFFKVSSNLRLIVGIILFSILFVLGILYLLEKVDFINMYNNARVFKKLGMTKITIDGDKNTILREHLKKSKKIRILSVTGDNLIKRIKDEIIYALSENKADIKLIIAKKGSDFVYEIETIENENRVGAISSEIENVERYVKEYLQEANKLSTIIGRLEVKHFNTQLRASIIICDNWGWYTLNLPPKRALQLPSIEFIKESRGFYGMCSDHFDSIWRSL